MALTRPAPAPPEPVAEPGRTGRAAARPVAAAAALIAAAVGTTAGMLGPSRDRALICGIEIAAALAAVAAFIPARDGDVSAPPTEAPAIPATLQPPDATPPGVRHAYVSLARRIQALVNRQLRELREMEERHGADPAVFADLLHLDHATALIGRLADSLAVLGGERTGRRWTSPAPLLAVCRGAMSRITEYRRVTIGPLPESAAVTGEAVEALVHALAELLDNATRYSPPHTTVLLRAVATADGLILEVEDRGVGLGPEARARAALVLSCENAGLEIAALGSTPRLGLAVVGRLARATGFEVSLAPGDAGGVRASILLPARLVTEAAPDPAAVAAAGARSRPEPARPTGPARHAAIGTVPAGTLNGLPRRQRTSPEGERLSATPPPAQPPPPSDAGPGQWLGQVLGPPREAASPRKTKEGMAP